MFNIENFILYGFFNVCKFYMLNKFWKYLKVIESDMLICFNVVNFIGSDIVWV